MKIIKVFINLLLRILPIVSCRFAIDISHENNPDEHGFRAFDFAEDSGVNLLDGLTYESFGYWVKLKDMKILRTPKLDLI